MPSETIIQWDELVKERDDWVSVKSEMIDVLQKEISNLENGTRE